MTLKNGTAKSDLLKSENEEELMLNPTCLGDSLSVHPKQRKTLENMLFGSKNIRFNDLTTLVISDSGYRA